MIFDKSIEKIILNLSRKDFTIKRIRKIHLNLLIFSLILFITIGLKWEINFSPNFSLTLKMNLIPWWSIIIFQNFITLFFWRYFKVFNRFVSKYKENLMNEKFIVLAFKDDQFQVGDMFEVNQNSHLGHLYSLGSFKDKKIFLGYAFVVNENIVNIDDSKIFKFISSKENRKLKLERLSNT